MAVAYRTIYLESCFWQIGYCKSNICCHLALFLVSVNSYRKYLAVAKSSFVNFVCLLFGVEQVVYIYMFYMFFSKKAAYCSQRCCESGDSKLQQ